ncbi:MULTISPECIES: IncP-type conjugal transfer protein TrbI [Agrobacterium]|uniref:IncP-type conjugal transfer protein TrbI n=1 Tax=Agrobacterium rubi TaxID=28099 RepID=A0AAE7UT35_9HYPH|nr:MULTISPECIES: IncP-type conjugal transfer protein TrbI [Agrobacterium]MBN7807739.1 IncP-type conjugal transfer protein TrbI [Agrobacterium rosae]NTE89700.1 IncP-type conjugal transfer protein TrbI [Agrobacterium rubi]NTF05450.1 IncP-type conjugal transfer protein TrbI [Agrobacterium rubi]NTF39893.1 IncP-type conjugal transfer protein TrbI [Agrobacterium rubi]OCJ44808.1 conjugal transfer protein TrbI [Agrobacterium rubi]
MVQSLQLGTSSQTGEQNGMRRLNRLPIIIAISVVVVFIGVVVIGLSLRGLSFNRGNLDDASNSPATSFGDQLKRGISDGIIGEPDKQEVFQPAPVEMEKSEKQQPIVERQSIEREERGQSLEPEEVWKARLKREQDEQYMREAQRQRMARIQARATALDSPLTVDVSDIDSPGNSKSDIGRQPPTSAANRTSDLYAAALQSGFVGQNADQNGQASKEDFFNQDIKDLGYLPNQVVPSMSPNELKRGSVIPATLITGLNSDLPGRITAQVSQNVYDSATGYRLLIPQGAKLFGRYDSKVSFGQERVLVVWTDLIFPNGSTLQIGGMAGTDAEGYGGFRDKVDRHLWRTFGSAALVAIIGSGIDMSMPQSSTLATQDTASDAARRNFAESFGRVAEQTISKNLNVQPTIHIRPGYKFNVLVDQDIIFPSNYRG